MGRSVSPRYQALGEHFLLSSSVQIIDTHGEHFANAYELCMYIADYMNCLYVTIISLEV